MHADDERDVDGQAAELGSKVVIGKKLSLASKNIRVRVVISRHRLRTGSMPIASVSGWTSVKDLPSATPNST